MCGRFQLVAPLDELIESFEVDVPTFDSWPVRWNVAPMQESLAILRGAEGERRLGPLRWGFVPEGADDPGVGSRMINARSETVATKPAFRDAFRRRRCIVPMTGFYEWRGETEGPKTPFLIRQPDGAPFAVAGLWSRWRGPDEAPLSTFTLLTTDASPWMAGIHDRMPVVLDAEGVAAWLDPGSDPARLQALLHPAPAGLLQAIEVSRAVNSPANDRPEVAEPVPGGERFPQAPPGPAETAQQTPG